MKKTKIVHPKAKITFRRNVLPPLLGFLMAAGVLGLLNYGWLVAQFQFRYQQIDRSVAAEPAIEPDPEAPAQLYIPSINVSTPIVTTEKSYDNAKVQLALRDGVVQFGASADPGQKGNIVIVGHSSGQAWAPGDYKFIFTLLEKIQLRDRIFLDFKGQRYIFRVEGMRTVAPTDLTVLQHGDEPQLTLITCTPVGTAKNRFVVTARQVSPDPAGAAPLTAEQTRTIPGMVIPN